MTNLLFEPGDRVLSPVDKDGGLVPGTVTARRVLKTRSRIDGYAETQTQVLVEFDERPSRHDWILCEACQPLSEE